MGQNNIEQRILLHKAFWNREEMKRPLVSFRIGDYFPSNQFKSSKSLLVDGKKITPELFDVDSFLEDYESLYQVTSKAGQDAFWVAEPFTGIPWIEAMLGCEVYGTKSSFITEPWAKSVDDLDKINLDIDNPWLKKFMEFAEKLNTLSDNRFPIGQPILRGISDVLGAVLGQSEFVYALFEEPEKMKKIIFKIVEIYRCIIDYYYSKISDFYGGHSIGFYHLWAPGKCIWYQEDLSALLSPDYYREFLKDADDRICTGYDYTAMHLHPASFFILDELMTMDKLKVIQVNKDIGGPSIKDMIPYFKKILTKKNLILYADMNEEEIDCIIQELPRKGILLNIVEENLERAQELMAYVRSKE